MESMDWVRRELTKALDDHAKVIDHGGIGLRLAVKAVIDGITPKPLPPKATHYGAREPLCRGSHNVATLALTQDRGKVTCKMCLRRLTP